ncbi:MAG: protein-L-isoaspartate O-methyltransferase [Gammaproteobacteria bacterium]|jgi:protein-L-isoaspartate(D-aspartate) O-methyltransferase|nr:protein-L-isoaspartate O-methyltransferase [Gammaproteobacteria bacterium]
MIGLVQKTNESLAKANMITQQIRPNGVDSEAILVLFADIPRAAFVPLQYQALAYSDTELPIGHHQTMLSPLLEGQILQNLNLSKKDTVLEVGTGSGYLTALLAKLCHYVYSVDKYSEFSHNAAKKLAQFNIDNVSLETGNAACGWPEHEPYDVIVLTASLPVLEKHFLTQLKLGGRLFAVVGEAPCQTALLVTRVGDAEWKQQRLFETVLPPLEDVATVEQFTF